jgi:transposase
MTNILKQVLAADVAKNELVVAFGRMSQDTSIDIFAYKTFSNNQKGFKGLLAWVMKLAVKEVKVRFVMEATGVYHEKLAYYLTAQGHEVSIVLPNKISNYAKTLEIKTVTDKTASQAICQFGLERKLDIWEKPKEIFRTIKQLTRERDQLIAERTMIKNQLHAEKTEAYPNKDSILRMNKRIHLINQQEKEIRLAVTKVIKQDDELAAKIDKISSIPGVGKLTAAIVMGETNGFELIRSKKQLINYAGMNVKEKQSGTSVKGKPKMSKKGNRHLRKAMHLPALSAIRHDLRFKAVFVRLVSKHGIKMKAVVAVQKKILEMIYTLWKTDAEYDRNYLQKISQHTQVCINN